MPAPRSMLALSALIICMAFVVSMVELLDPRTTSEIRSIIVTAWLGAGGLGAVCAWWFGSSLGSRVKSSPAAPADQPPATTAKGTEDGTSSGV